jgi:hypothetical protein
VKKVKRFIGMVEFPYLQQTWKNPCTSKQVVADNSKEDVFVAIRFSQQNVVFQVIDYDSVLLCILYDHPAAVCGTRKNVASLQREKGVIDGELVFSKVGVVRHVDYCD